ncbi:YhcN/YlaJ family sporulation lipoprotein [Fictibacillus iocasae]|uniref:YhcN/YlaJ family sporulation lipoprotein n=1 Tax=Fictibacillus iocasae TaxID=2715437 RepID=A0ABW2NR79_9BACL
MKRCAFWLVCLMAASGCGNVFTKETDQHYRNPSKVSHELPNSENDSPVVEEKSSEVHYAKEISKLADKVKGVKKSHVIVTGMYTLIGIEREGRPSSTEDHLLRRRVYESVKDNSHGRTAAITTDQKKVMQIQRLGVQIGEGHHDMKGKIYNQVGVLIGQIPPLSGQYKNTKMEDAKKQDGNKGRSDIYE